MHSNQCHFWLPLCLLLLLGFIWGTGYTFARFATTHGVSPLGYSFWQSLGPALFLGLLSRNKFSFSNLTKHWRYFLIASLTGIVLPNTNMYFAAPHLPAGLLAVIVNTVPIFAYPLALIAKREVFTGLRIGGVGLALVGVMLIIAPHTNLPSPSAMLWTLLALFTPLSFAFCSVYISRYSPTNSDSASLAAGTLIFSSLFLMPIVVTSGNFYSLHLPLTSPDIAIVLEILFSSLGYILFFKLIKIAGPVYYSLVAGMVALTGLFWGYVVFHEHMTTLENAGVIFILLALFLVNKPQQTMLKSLSAS